MRGVTYAIFKFCLLFNDSGIVTLDQLKEKKIGLFYVEGRNIIGTQVI